MGAFDQWIEFATFVNTVTALAPIVVIVPKQTQIISESMIAYSTAVGPSSEVKNRRNFKVNDAMVTTFPHYWACT
jgi:hypothetical protein